MKNLTETEKAYIAGLLDGEGSIMIFKRHRFKVPQYILETKIVNTNKKVLKWVQKKIKGKIDKSIENQKWKTRWTWRINKKETIHQFLKAIFPYLIIKEKHALIALQLQRGQNPLSKMERILRENLYQQLKKLNKRGK